MKKLQNIEEKVFMEVYKWLPKTDVKSNLKRSRTKIGLSIRLFCRIVALMKSDESIKNKIL